MSNENPTPPNPLNNPEVFEFFAFTIENEVAVVVPVTINTELLVAAWSSNPKVIKLTPEQKNIVQQGFTFNDADSTFTDPSPVIGQRLP